MAQAKAQSSSFRLDVARAIVSAKLRNYAAVTVRFKLAADAGTQPSVGLRDMAERLSSAQTLDEARGLEGQGGAIYFAAMQSSLPPEWEFAGRKRRPPPDPVNSMLSLGYTLLYHHASTALLGAGLNPRLGLLHEPHGAHDALASDLVEEFRHLVDRQVWAMIHRREVTPADFVREAGACYMTREFRGRFFEEFDRRLMETLFTPLGLQSQSYREFMDYQARQLRAVIVGERSEYVPLKEHA